MSTKLTEEDEKTISLIKESILEEKEEDYTTMLAGYAEALSKLAPMVGEIPHLWYTIKELAENALMCGRSIR